MRGKIKEHAFDDWNSSGNSPLVRCKEEGANGEMVLRTSMTTPISLDKQDPFGVFENALARNAMARIGDNR